MSIGVKIADLDVEFVNYLGSYLAFSREKRVFKHADSVAHVARGAFCNIKKHVVAHTALKSRLLLKEDECPLERADARVRLYRLELKERGARDYRVIYVKMRIFGGGSDQRDSSVLDVLKESLLLLAVKILYLVYVEKNSRACKNTVG